MKRLLLTILMLGWAGSAFAAGTCVESSTTSVYTDSGVGGKVVLLLCTHHTDNSLSAAVAASTMNKMSGLFIDRIVTKPGTTAPTDNTDLSIVDAIGRTVVAVGDGGLNAVDATTVVETQPYNAKKTAYDVFWVTDDAFTVSTANNAVASATFYIYIYLTPQR